MSLPSIYQWFAINTSASGDSVIIAGQPGTRIRVYRIWFTNDADTLITFKDGASVAFTGPVNFVDARSITLDYEETPWFITSPGNSFVINQTGTAQLSGKVDFVQG